MLAKENILELMHSKKTEWSKNYTVCRIGLFGSVVREQSKPDSDIDIVVEMEFPTFDRYMDLKFELQDLLGRDVDLVLYDSIKKRLKPVIDDEVVYA